jgi:hypothetical protein
MATRYLKFNGAVYVREAAAPAQAWEQVQKHLLAAEQKRNPSTMMALKKSVLELLRSLGPAARDSKKPDAKRAFKLLDDLVNRVFPLEGAEREPSVNLDDLRQAIFKIYGLYSGVPAMTFSPQEIPQQEAYAAASTGAIMSTAKYLKFQGATYRLADMPAIEQQEGLLAEELGKESPNNAEDRAARKERASAALRYKAYEKLWTEITNSDQLSWVTLEDDSKTSVVWSNKFDKNTGMLSCVGKFKQGSNPDNLDLSLRSHVVRREVMTSLIAKAFDAANVKPTIPQPEDDKRAATWLGLPLNTRIDFWTDDAGLHLDAARDEAPAAKRY